MKKGNKMKNEKCCNSGICTEHDETCAEHEEQTEAAAELTTEDIAQQKTEEIDKVAEMRNILQRLQADFENYKKRVARDQEEYCKFATKNIIKNLLPVVDNMHLALQNKNNIEEFYKGIELIYAQLFEILREQGLEPIEALGKSFDPHQHEALLQEANPAPAGTVLEELQKGYILGNTVIRPSKVKISKGMPDGTVQQPQQSSVGNN